MRTIIRLVLVLVLVVGVGALVVGYWAGTSRTGTDVPVRETNGVGGVNGGLEVDRERARERGAEVGEKVAVAGERIRETLAGGALLAKIKSKMALDDIVKARTVDVSVNHDVVTLSGVVRSAVERDRAVALARETDGVREVVNHLEVRP